MFFFANFVLTFCSFRPNFYFLDPDPHLDLDLKEGDADP